MAVIPSFYTNVVSFDVLREDDNGDLVTIKAGAPVMIGTDKKVTNASGAANLYAVGIAGDSQANDRSYNAYSAQLIVSGNGAKKWDYNSITDMYDETLSSGKISVYIGTGLFYTTEYDTAVSYLPGRPLYATNGKFTTAASTNSQIVGRVADGVEAYPSGVPGINPGYPGVAYTGSTSLGDFLAVLLSI